MDPTIVMEGGAVGVAALGFARRRPLRRRVRREPIDVEQLTAELAGPRVRSRQEIVAALEAEVQRARQARAPRAAAEPELVAELVVEPDTVDAVLPAVVDPVAPFETPIVLPGAGDAGLPLDQVRAWLEQVKGDLRKVQARVQYLELEQQRLQDQHHLVAELITSSTPV